MPESVTGFPELSVTLTSTGSETFFVAVKLAVGAKISTSREPGVVAVTGME